MVENYTKSLIDYYENGETTYNFVKAFLEEVSNIYDLAENVLNSRDIDTATGKELDYIGFLVGELRQSRSDEDFRVGIKLRIAINTSKGTVEDIIRILNLLLPDNNGISLRRAGSAKLTLSLGVLPLSLDLENFLYSIIPAGVELVGISYDSLPLIFTERGGTVTDTGILPERGITSGDVRIAPERE